MNAADRPFRSGPSPEHLVRRQEYLQLILDSHRRWMGETNDPAVRQRHGDLVRSLVHVIEQYKLLLDEVLHQT